WTDWTQQDRTKFANAFRDMCIADSYHSASNLIKAVTESATKMELGPARKAFNYMALVLEQKLTDEISRERSAVADSGRTPFTEYMGRETMSPAEREVARYHGRALD
ncbi:MAG: hypothetical protein WCK90_02905, partial [archaeon]